MYGDVVLNFKHWMVIQNQTLILFRSTFFSLCVFMCSQL